MESLWPFGLSSVGNVTFESAAYIARYCVQKVTGDRAKSHYEFVTDDGEVVDRVPEFNRMSLNPAVGKRWLEKFRSDVYPRDYVVVNGVKTKPPKYYDALFERDNPLDFAELVAKREFDMSQLRVQDPDEFRDLRMCVKEQVTLARSGQLKRTL